MPTGLPQADSSGTARNSRLIGAKEKGEIRVLNIVLQ
jgi:hypothetical protein